VVEKKKVRNIGVDAKAPAEVCSDKNCPFHGTLSVRGQMLIGVVKSNKMQDSILVKRDFMHYVQKYERYEKRTSTIAAHCPPCIKTRVGDKVRIAECRPLSKTISFVTIEKI
jgi:small subunit ribosomal protein S17